MRRSYLGWLFIVGLLLGSAFSSIVSAEEAKFEYNGYWRLGLNTGANVLEDASDVQGFGKFGELKTSRHTRDPNYFWLRVGRIFENQMQAVIKIDSDAMLPHENGTWGDPNANILRVRDLYLQLPLWEKSYVWAGARVFEFEDIRLFDYLNWFNVNAHGVGAKLDDTQIVLSFAKETLKDTQLQYVDGSGAPATPPAGTALTATRRNTTLMVRHEIALGSMTLKPMAKIDHFGSIQEDKSDPALIQKKVKGADQYSVGGVLSSSTDHSWHNTHLWISSVPTDTTGVVKGSDNVIGAGYSASYDFQTFGVLTALWAENVRFKTAQQVYEVKSATLAPKGADTTKSTFKYSLGVQPQYYITDRVHLGLDLNHAAKTKKTRVDDANVTLITPLLRYAMSRNPLGTPQIYTSVTHGSYDWKAKRGADGKPTKSLVTTQTGFELWF